MPTEPAEQQPYKPSRIIERVSVPDTIKIPEIDEKAIMVAEYIYNRNAKDPHKLPEEYSDFEKFLEDIYQRGYREKRWIDVVPNALDIVSQQYNIKRDEELGKNGTNTFGIFGISYLDALATYRDKSERYFEAKKPPEKRGHHRGLLLGCSSISSAVEFVSFIKAIDPKADAIVADIDPIATQLAKKAEGAMVVLADAQNIPLADNSVDFVATNFLVQNLIDRRGSGKAILEVMLKEVARILTPTGRLAMVEQLSDNTLEWLESYAFHVRLVHRQTPGSNNMAVIFKRRRPSSNFARYVPDFVQDQEAYANTLPSKSHYYAGSGVELNHIKALIFEQDPMKYDGTKFLESVYVIDKGISF